MMILVSVLFRINQEAWTSQKYVTYDVVFALPVSGCWPRGRDAME
jgi:hypothetical protein